MKHAALALTLAGVCLATSACDAIIGVDERYAGDPDAATTDEPSNGSDASTADGDAAPTTDGGTEDGGPLTPQVLGTFVDPTVAYGETELLVLDRAGQRNKIVLIAKSAPTAPKTIYDEPSDTIDKRVSTLAIARGQVWFSTVDKKLHRMGLDGSNPTIVDVPSVAILARSAGAVWLASPDDLSNAPTLRWLRDDVYSGLPEAQLALGGPAMFSRASDDELVVTSRTSGGQWTLSRWRPLATTPLQTFATFDAYPSWVAVDPSRVLVYGEDEGTVVSWSRTTSQATPTTVLVDVKAPVRIESDGTQLVLLSQTDLHTCAIASCAGTRRRITTPTPFVKARYLHIDAHYAYFAYAKTDTSTMTLVRVPR